MLAFIPMLLSNRSNSSYHSLPNVIHCRSNSPKLITLPLVPKFNCRTILLTSHIHWKLPGETLNYGYPPGQSKQKGWFLSISAQEHPSTNLARIKLHEPVVLTVTWATDYSIQSRHPGGQIAQPRTSLVKASFKALSDQRPHGSFLHWCPFGFWNGSSFRCPALCPKC